MEYGNLHILTIRVWLLGESCDNKNRQRGLVSTFIRKYNIIGNKLNKNRCCNFMDSKNTEKMGKIIELNKNRNILHPEVLNRIIEEDAQEDSDEKKRKNKRTEKWDDLLYTSACLFIILFVLIILGIIQIQPCMSYFIGGGGLTTIIVSIFKFVKRQNSS